MNFITSVLFLMTILYGYQCAPLENEQKNVIDYIQTLQQKIQDIYKLLPINPQETHNSAQQLTENVQKKRQELQKEREQIHQEAQNNAQRLQENERKIQELQQQEEIQKRTYQRTEDSMNSLVPQHAKILAAIEIGPKITDTTGFTYDRESMEVHIRDRIEHRVETYSNSKTNETKIFRYSRDWNEPNSMYIPY